jgi:hypothetical protein
MEIIRYKRAKRDHLPEVETVDTIQRGPPGPRGKQGEKGDRGQDGFVDLATGMTFTAEQTFKAGATVGATTDSNTSLLKVEHHGGSTSNALQIDRGSTTTASITADGNTSIGGTLDVIGAITGGSEASGGGSTDGVAGTLKLFGGTTDTAGSTLQKADIDRIHELESGDSPTFASLTLDPSVYDTTFSLARLNSNIRAYDQFQEHLKIVTTKRNYHIGSVDLSADPVEDTISAFAIAMTAGGTPDPDPVFVVDNQGLCDMPALRLKGGSTATGLVVGDNNFVADGTTLNFLGDTSNTGTEVTLFSHADSENFRLYMGIGQLGTEFRIDEDTGLFELKHYGLSSTQANAGTNPEIVIHSRYGDTRFKALNNDVMTLSSTAITASKQITATSITASGTITAAKFVTGNLTIDDSTDEIVHSTANLQFTTSASGTDIVVKPADKFIVSGASSTFEVIASNGNTSIEGTLDVTGATTLSSLTASSLTASSLELIASGIGSETAILEKADIDRLHELESGDSPTFAGLTTTNAITTSSGFFQEGSLPLHHSETWDISYDIAGDTFHDFFQHDSETDRQWGNRPLTIRDGTVNFSNINKVHRGSTSAWRIDKNSNASNYVRISSTDYNDAAAFTLTNSAYVGTWRIRFDMEYNHRESGNNLNVNHEIGIQARKFKAGQMDGTTQINHEAITISNDLCSGLPVASVGAIRNNHPGKGPTMSLEMVLDITSDYVTSSSALSGNQTFLWFQTHAVDEARNERLWDSNDAINQLHYNVTRLSISFEYLGSSD